MAISTRLQNPVQPSESFNKRFGLALAEREPVKAAWELEPLRTTSGVIQVFTSAAKGPGFTLEAAY